MNLLVITIIIVFLFCLIHHRIKESIFLYLITFSLIVCQHALVDETTVPADIENYFEMFYEFGRYSFLGYLHNSSSIEVGYFFLNKIIYFFSHNHYSLLTVYSIVLVSLYFVSIRKYSTDFFISVLYFLFIFNNQALFVLRQHLAIAIVLFSYQYIIDRKVFKFIGITALAVSMHMTAIIWLPAYFIYGIKNSKKLLLGLSIAGIILFYIMNNLIWINQYFNLGYDAYTIGEKSMSSNFTEFFMYLPVLVIYFITLKDDLFKEGINKLITIGLFITVIGLFVGTNLSLLSRLMHYYKVSLLFAVPLIMSHMKAPVLKMAFLVCSSALFFIAGFYGNSTENTMLIKFHIVNISFLLLTLVLGSIVFYYTQRNISKYNDQLTQ